MSTADLNPVKLRTVAAIAHSVLSVGMADLDKTIARQMLEEGIRKLHDSATSFRGQGKYRGHAHWSRSAQKILNNNGGTQRGITGLLSHEHVVPVNVVLDILLRNSATATTNDIEELILSYSVVAIITREEEAILTGAGLKSRMPDGWDGRDVWARYKATGLYEHIEPVPA